METRRKESGQSLVEMALILMVSILLVSGLIDFGRAYFTQVSLHDASQEGAFYASLDPTDTATIHDKIHYSSDSPVDLSSAAITITPSGGLCANDINTISVTVTIQFDFYMPVMNMFVEGGTMPLSATTVNKILSPACP